MDVKRVIHRAGPTVSVSCRRICWLCSVALVPRSAASRAFSSTFELPCSVDSGRSGSPSIHCQPMRSSCWQNGLSMRSYSHWIFMGQPMSWRCYRFPPIGSRGCRQLWYEHGANLGAKMQWNIVPQGWREDRLPSCGIDYAASVDGGRFKYARISALTRSISAR